MGPLVIGNRTFRIVVERRSGVWVGWAVHETTGEVFGGEWSGATEADAVEALKRWLEWQHEHAVALSALQDAERIYHRTIAGSAFASPAESPSPIERQKASLAALDAARIRLDDVRARRPH